MEEDSGWSDSSSDDVTPFDETTTIVIAVVTVVGILLIVFVICAICWKIRKNSQPHEEPARAAVHREEQPVIPRRIEVTPETIENRYPK